jgi:hypothetical protein
MTVHQTIPSPAANGASNVSDPMDPTDDNFHKTIVEHLADGV